MGCQHLERICDGPVPPKNPYDKDVHETAMKPPQQIQSDRKVIEGKGKTGIRIIPQKPPLVKSILESAPLGDDEKVIPILGIPKKRQPDLPPIIYARLYGIPGQNIFTYELEKPKSRQRFVEHIGAGMVPLKGVTIPSRGIRRLNKALNGSLDDSLLPLSDGVVKKCSRALINRAHISQLDDSLVAKTSERLIPQSRRHFEVRSNIGANLLPLYNARVSQRKHFCFETKSLFEALEECGMQQV